MSDLEMIKTAETICTVKTVNHIAISVSDLSRSKSWYCQMFDLKVIQENPDSILLGFGETMLVLRVDKNPGTISHFMLGIDDFQEKTLRERLLGAGLDPQKDADSFHIRDPDGLNVQVGDRGLGLADGIVENNFKMK